MQKTKWTTMHTNRSKIIALDWPNISNSLHQNGFVLIPRLLVKEQCEQLKRSYHQEGQYRKTVIMERHRFGLGEYKYFNYPLPSLIEEIRTTIYPYLAPIANTWFKALHLDQQFPLSHAELLAQCHDHNQKQATALLLKYGEGGYNTLHQDLYGTVYFPLQLVLFLTEPEEDFSGGEFVLMEQIPRAQSKAIVLTPRKGDALIFTTNFRPIKGAKGYYRANMKHGVSEVHQGERYTLGIIFHDAIS
ncbi:2OG-Fe(II) oxygenase [Olivibacter ginsenosidimutans]|uniref:2OG-Fe(II) oxygenase n=1 Tax=Olivibacter ginsenosidimutans TaxID=1176537 RepID=A0ABP9CBL4_9SPHI